MDNEVYGVHVASGLLECPSQRDVVEIRSTRRADRRRFLNGNGGKNQLVLHRCRTRLDTR